MDRLPLVSVVIVNYNARSFLRDCLMSILNADYPNIEVVLVDNASTDSSLEYVREAFGLDSRLRVVANDSNVYVCEGNNIGAKYAKGDYLLFINPDVKVQDKAWLRTLVTTMEADNSIGIVQPVITEWNSTLIQCAGLLLHPVGFCYSYNLGEDYDVVVRRNTRPYSAFVVMGTCMMIRRNVYDEIRGFDPLLLWSGEDHDLCWRVWLRGYRVMVVPSVKVDHYWHGCVRLLDESLPRLSIKQAFRNTSRIIIKNGSFTSIRWLNLFITSIFLNIILAFRYRLYTWPCILLSALQWNVENFPNTLQERRKTTTKYRNHFLDGVTRHLPLSQVRRKLNKFDIFR